MNRIHLKNLLERKSLAIIISVAVSDQLTKLLIKIFVPIYHAIPVLPFFNIVHAKNRGAAFSLFHYSSPLFRFLFFGVVSIICLWLLIYWLSTLPQKEKFQRLALSLILGGAVGNLIDRVLYGEVTDFIDVYYDIYHWPAFNVADSAITIGVSCLMMKFLPPSLWNFFKRKKKKGS